MNANRRVPLRGRSAIWTMPLIGRVDKPGPCLSRRGALLDCRRVLLDFEMCRPRRYSKVAREDVQNAREADLLFNDGYRLGRKRRDVQRLDAFCAGLRAWRRFLERFGCWLRLSYRHGKAASINR